MAENSAAVPMGGEGVPTPAVEKVMVATIRKLEAKVTQSIVNINLLPKIHKLVATNTLSYPVVISGTQALRRLFTAALNDSSSLGSSSKKRKISETKADESKKGGNPRQAYFSWVKKKFDDFAALLLTLLHHPDPRVQEASLRSLLSFVVHPNALANTEAQPFSKSLLKRIIQYMVALPLTDANQMLLEVYCNDFVEKFDDVRYHTLHTLDVLLKSETEAIADGIAKIRGQADDKLRAVGSGDSSATNVAAAKFNAVSAALGSDSAQVSDVLPPQLLAILQQKLGGDAANAADLPTKESILAELTSSDDLIESFMRNSFELLSSVSVPQGSATGSKVKTLCTPKKPLKGIDAPAQRAALSRCWLSLLSSKAGLSSSMYTTVLLQMKSRIIPAVTNPLLLADFLSESFDQGGIASVLALDGLFTLISQHGFEYPLFYPQLYSVLELDLFHSEYRERFFRALNLFLSSQYIPSYMVASFAKRLARLALSAPADGCLFILSLIFTLLARFPSVQILVDRSNETIKRALVNIPSSSDVADEESDDDASNSDDDSDASSEPMSDDGTDESPDAASSTSSPRVDKAATKRTIPSFSRQEDLSTIRSEHISDAARRTIELKSDAMLADPFREHEHDMKKCRALESSLWEVCALQRHYHPKVSRSAHLLLSGGSSDGKTKSASQAAPYPVAEVCDQSYDLLFSTEAKHRTAGTGTSGGAVPLEFEFEDTPDALFREDIFTDLWKI